MKRVLFVYLFILSAGAFGQLNNSNVDQKVTLNRSIEYFIDSTSMLEYADISRLNFRKVSGDVMRVGASNNSLWLKLTLKNSTSENYEGYIHFEDPSIHILDMYHEGDVLHSGVSASQNEKAVKGHHNVFPIGLLTEESKTVYFKIRSFNKMTLNTYLIPSFLYLDELQEERFTLGMFYGSMLLVFAYSIMLLITTRMRMFAYYAVYVFFIALLCGAGDGTTGEFFHAWVQWKGGFQDAASAAIANILGVMFMILFLDLKSWSARLYRISVFFMIGMGLVSLVLIQLEHLIVFDFLGLYGLLNLGLILLVSYIAVRKKVPQSGFFLSAYVVFGVFITLFILNLYRVVPYSFWAQYAIHLGYGLSLAILSYGLAVRVYSFYKALLERELEKQELIKTKNEELEEQVIQRTNFLKEKEGNLRSIIDNHIYNIWLIDTEYKVIDFNSVFAHDWEVTYGKKLELGVSIIEQTPVPNLKTKWKIRYDLALDGKLGEYNDEYVLNDVSRIFNIKTFPIFEEGKIRGVSVFASDISEQVKVRKQLEGQNNMLKKVNEELDSFVYSASHDLKAPLASVLGLIELSKKEPDKKEQIKYFDMMEHSINRLDQFIKDIIDYSRNARTSVELQKIDIQQLLDNIFSDLIYVYPENKVTPKFSIDQKADLFLDETRLKVILRNLISNALKYGCTKKSNNQIEITADINDKRLFFSVKDFGPGILPEYHSNIFNMFFRAHEKTQGSGLGLYIVKETVLKLGGKISLESDQNKGATFIVELPNQKMSNG